MGKLVFYLIDDDVDDREIFELALNHVGSDHVCVTTGCGKKALERLISDEAFLPHYIFLDLNMPIFSGKQCLREIKKIPRLKNIPVIIISTSSVQSDIEDTRLLGADHYVVKPNSIIDLSHAIESLIGMPDIKFSVIKKVRHIPHL